MMEPCSLPSSPVTVQSFSTTIFALDHSIKGVGKRRGESKREVFWRFAIEETQQQEEQQQQDEDNGENPNSTITTASTTAISSTATLKEYEILFLWSFSSGKQSISVNGVEEYFTRRKGASVFDHSFEYDGLQLQVIGTRIKPNKAPSNFRCFELLINGTSFFECLKPDTGIHNITNGVHHHQQQQQHSIEGVTFYPSPTSALESTVDRHRHHNNAESTTIPTSILYILYPDHRDSIQSSNKVAAASNQQEVPTSTSADDNSVDMFDPVGSSMRSFLPPPSGGVST